MKVWVQDPGSPGINGFTKAAAKQHAYLIYFFILK